MRRGDVKNSIVPETYVFEGAKHSITELRPYRERRGDDMHTYFRFIKRTYPSAESGSTHALSFMCIFSKE
jgi:hypothetical protein